MNVDCWKRLQNSHIEMLQNTDVGVVLSSGIASVVRSLMLR